MSKTPLRVAAGLTAALGLAAFAWPTVASPDSEPAPVVRTAAVSEPVIVGFVAQDAVSSPAEVIDELSAQIAHDIAEARYIRHVEAVAAWQAAEAERLAVEAWMAGEARQAEEARRAGEARAEQERAAAAAAAAPAGSLEAIIQRHFGDATPEAIRIAQCESGMDPNAVSPTDDHGLFQINIVHKDQFEAVTGAPWSSIYDPELNTFFARHLHARQGWGPWSCAR